MASLDICLAEGRCMVCGEQDDTEESSFGERLLLICSSCSFGCIHVGCEEKRTKTQISEATAMDPENLWFCSPECERVNRQFEPLVRSTVLPGAGRTIEVVGTSGRKRGDSMQADAALRILRGSFEPLIMENGRCLIEMVVNSFVTPAEEETEEDPGHDYKIPFVGTREDFRKQGALRMLFAAIETVLTELKVSQILIPSIRSLKRMWCQNFLFERMTLDEVAKVEDHIVFPDQDSCILLRKRLGQAVAPLHVAPYARTEGNNQIVEGRKARRAAVQARKAMAPSDTGASSDSDDQSGESADVHMSSADEQETASDAEEAPKDQECLEQCSKPVEQDTQNKPASVDPEIQHSSDILKLKALRTVIGCGALSVTMNSAQQIIARKARPSHRRFQVPKFSYEEKLTIIMSQVARSESTAQDLWKHAQR